jgi:hypothetical protein
MVATHSGQASHVLRGYRYQLLQSLDAWLELKRTETLWLETEEDFSIATVASSVDTQVKSSSAATGPKSHSLQSKDVCAALRRYWTRSDQGRDPRPRLAFIANGTAARERNLEFPRGVAGIDYWGAAVIDADTGPIRTALAAIFDDQPLGQWIKSNPSDQELRTRLLSRVRWMLRASAEGPLTDLIRDKIAELYLTKGLLVTVADEALRSLLDRVFETACDADPNDRHLTVLDLHRSLELAAGPSALLQESVRALTGAGIGTLPDGLFVSRLGQPTTNVIDRHLTVEQLMTQARGEPLIWLHGAHGVGKSTLARLVAREIGGVWLALDLRSVQDDGRAALVSWRDLIRAVHREEHVAGVVIDDLVGPALEALRTRLSAFISSIAPYGTRVIVTSSYQPSVARLAELSASSNAALQAPYFSEQDLRALVTAQDGPPNEAVEGWARLILLTTNGGHPLLACAKIASLRARGWPRSALAEDIGPRTSDAVRTTREEARRRLLDEIPMPEARHLLRRLGCVFDRADTALIFKLAQQHSAIPNAGDVLALLRGSWIEVMPANDLRLSPLIADISSDVAEEELIQCRRTAAEHWLTLGALDQRTLPLCFWNAFLGRHTWILANVCQAIETLPEEQVRGAAALLSPMTLLRTDAPIYPAMLELGTMLRLLQFEVANAVEDSEIAERAAISLIAEIESISHFEFRLLANSIAIPKVLLAKNTNLNPALQLDWALRLRVVLEEIIAHAQPELSRPIAWLTTTFPAGADLPGFLFAVLVTRIRSSERMLAMIEALDGINESDRNNFLDSAGISGMGGGAFVHNGWAQEQLDNLDLRPALQCFQRMSAITMRWGRTDIQAQLVCAQSVIADEGLNDRTAAINIVDDAMGALGAMPELIRQKAKVLSHTGNDAAGANLLISVEDVVGRDNLLDRALALRDGGVWAARAGLFRDAIRLFRKAHAALDAESGHPGLAVGIQIEIGLALWTSGDRAGGIAALAEALDAVELLDQAASRQNERAHQFARAVVGLFWRKLDPYPSSPLRNIAFGQASALSGDEPLLGIDLKPLAYNWRILALCEIELGINVGIDSRSLAKQVRGSLASVEMFIAMARYGQAVVKRDIMDAFRLGILAISAYKLTQDLAAGDTEENRVEVNWLEQQGPEVLANEGMADILRTIPIDQFLAHRLQGVWNPELVGQVEAACRANWGDTAMISEILRAASGERIDDSPAASAALAARLASEPDLKGNPRARFERDLLLISHVAYSLARRVLEPLLIPKIVEGWSSVLRDETFALWAPLQYAPAIETAVVEMQTSGLKRAARLMLVAAPAVRASLSVSWIELLQKISNDDLQERG